MDAQLIVGAAAVLVGLGALLRGRAKQSEASAAAVSELIVQIGAVRRDLERETLARIALQAQVDRQDELLAEARSRAAHLEGQLHVLTIEKQQAVAWAAALAQELADLRRALEGGHHTITLPPPRG